MLLGDCPPETLVSALRTVRNVQPDVPLIVLLEDIDSLVQRFCESTVLNLLDGVSGVSKVVYIATTNYPERLGERIINRPSRFDRRYYFGPPSPICRKAFFKFLFSQGAENYDDVAVADIDRWVDDTEGLSFAHLKELFISVIVMGNSYDQALKQVKGLFTLPNSKEYKGDGPVTDDRKVVVAAEAPTYEDA